MSEDLEFDPGFAPYILAFRGTVEYLYMDINRFKNLSQRKMKFRQYYKKFLELFNNNLGFYVGCLMWAAYIKTQPWSRIFLTIIVWAASIIKKKMFPMLIL